MWRRKVVWSEGQFLRPQHFQQQERYFERLVDHRSGALQSFGWGFEALELDDAALATGRFAIRHARGILPDGTIFDFPAEDPPPDGLTIGADTPRDVLVYLAVIAERPGMPVATLDESADPSGVRFGAEAFDAVDSNAGFAEPAPIQVGRLRTHLLLAPDLGGAFCAIPVARLIERRADGQVLIDREFAGPSLSVADTPSLRAWVSELRGLLGQRVEALAARMTQPGRGGVAEIADFLLLQSVNRAGALFEHLQSLPRLHPETLYLHCVQLAGELAGYGTERRLPRPFPPYEHDDPLASFRPVMAQLRQSLSMVLEQNAVPIELQLRKYGVRVAIIPDKGLLSAASFVLAASAQVPAEILRQRFPTQLKMGPVEKIRDLVTLQLPGIGLRPLPVAPRQIPYHAGFHYFELDTRHDLWLALQNSGGLAMHLAGEYPGLEMELWAVRG